LDTAPTLLLGGSGAPVASTDTASDKSRASFA